MYGGNEEKGYWTLGQLRLMPRVQMKRRWAAIYLRHDISDIAQSWICRMRQADGSQG